MNKPNALQIIFAIGIVLAVLTGGEHSGIGLMIVGLILAGW